MILLSLKSSNKRNKENNDKNKKRKKKFAVSMTQFGNCLGKFNCKGAVHWDKSSCW